MKSFKIKLVMGGVAAVLLASLASCTRLDDVIDVTSTDVTSTGVTSTDSSYDLELTSGDSATVNVDSSLTVYVADTDSYEVSSSSTGKLDITNNGDGIYTLKGVTEGSVSVTFMKSDDEDGTYDKSVTIYVYNPIYTVNITLDDAVAKNAASVSVTYAGKEDSDETYDTYQADVDYTAGETSCKAYFVKSYSNYYKYFNNISVNVKDSDGNILSIAYTPTYFCYTDSSCGSISVSEPVESKTFTITFTGFTIPGGSVEGVRYCKTWASSSSEWSEDDVTTPTVTVAEDGASATFDVTLDSLDSSKTEFYIDWTAVTLKDSSSNTMEGITGLTESNQWYSYDSSSLAITAGYVDTSVTYTTLLEATDFTVNEESYTQILESSKFTDLTISTIAVTVEAGTDNAVTWASISGADGYTSGIYQGKALGTTIYITDSTFIDAIKTNGLYIQSDAGTYTVIVEYN